MTGTYWTRRSPRGVWHLGGSAGRALCGTHLGYGPASFRDTADQGKSCARCLAKAAK